MLFEHRRTIKHVAADKHRRSIGLKSNYAHKLRVNQRTIDPENAHLKPDPGVLSHHEMTLTLNTHTPLLTS